MNKKFFFIPVAAFLVCSTLFFTNLDNKILDLFQRALPSTKESPKVLMVNIDDTAIQEIGIWPLSRDIYAESLYVLKNLGAAQAVFDLSFIDKSPAKVDENYVTQTLPSYIQNDFELLLQSVNEKGIQEAVSEAQNSILTSTSYVIRPLDEILAQSLSFFGNSFTNITMSEDVALSDDDRNFLQNYVALENVVSEADDLTPSADSIMPSLRMLVEKSAGSGFVNADPDTDGYIRRLHLVIKSGEKYYGQLIFVPILKYYGNPQVVVSKNSIVLKDALVNGEKKTLKIPRDRDGSVILKFPKKNYIDYNYISLWDIYRISLIENSLAKTVAQMDESGLFSLLDDSPQDAYATVAYLKNELMNGENPELDVTFENYFAYRKAFIENLEYALSDEYYQILAEEISDDEELVQSVNETFQIARSNFEVFKTSSADLEKQVRDAMCIFGTSATSTTDYGLTLYEEHYPNPGVHYTLANQLLSLDFISDAPAAISFAFAFVLCFGMTFLNLKLKGTGRQIALGLVFTAFSVLVLFVCFVASRIYIGAAIPFSSTFVTFVALTVLGFVTASKDKKFITNAFGQCLSKEVVKEIVEHPESFKLGGQKLEMTAIFTDIQKFSSFSELLTAGELVALLNYYLTKMSDIIMDERGTVDKYEGDAIIALVGAPVKMNDHAERAVRAAIKMKQAELVMNEEIKKIAAEPKPENFDDELYSAFSILVKNGKTIFTRIGINSGEMIAGYMGSENKKNYTMMGNNVNLASRLEGVNKQYSTGGILISESTKNLLGDAFVLRRLDRVQVVNVNTPLRLYEPMALKSEADEGLVEYVSSWESAMDLFEEGKYAESLDKFNELVQKSRQDNVLKYYIRLISDFFAKGKVPEEADGIGVAYNSELRAFRLLQK
ncbi:MAG: adenylate/guanylate cyclase domain-containing protein [Treponema sp.]|nr:adenylate/guanylate cyclase domain-containing protein [Candidatus Treponema equifaecale]